MRELGEDHSVILSTHILSEVQSLCDRVLIINQGNIVLDQALKELQGNTNKPATIEVGLHRPPAPESILAIDGVTSLENNSNNDLQININPDSNAADEIVKKAVQEDWGLYKLNPGDTSLESTFMRLTYGEQELEQSGEEA